MTVSLSFISKSLPTSIDFCLFKITRARLNSFLDNQLRYEIHTKLLKSIHNNDNNKTSSTEIDTLSPSSFRQECNRLN